MSIVQKQMNDNLHHGRLAYKMDINTNTLNRQLPTLTDM